MKRNLIKISCFVIIYMLAPGCHPGSSRQASNVNDPAREEKNQVTRYGSVIKLKPEKYDLYRELHANPWPAVDSLLKVSNIRNYSIYYRDGYLFSYLEYTGENWETDMARLSTEPVIQEWWKLTDPCQEPVESAAEGEWWAPMMELYHLD